MQSANSHLGISVIVPLLNERAVLPNLKSCLERLKPNQIILVDGGSADGTQQWVSENWNADSLLLLSSRAGRAEQMNAGALKADQAMLLFLHADTQLPSDAREQICHSQGAPKAPANRWGRFDIGFSSNSRAMRVIAWFINHRSRLSGIATGDQAIFVHRQLFNQAGGFDAIPLMEDIALCKKLRHIQAPFCSRSIAITSARRWEKNGVARTVLKMWWFRFAYFVGVSPAYLARSYRNVRK